MPHIDFREAFSSPDDRDSAKAGVSQPVDPAQPANPVDRVEPSRFRRSRFGRSDWANIIFVVIAIVGGLFCAFYFFNGAELLRSVAAWPREFLYRQPSQSAEDAARLRLAAALGLPLPAGAGAADHSGDPFSRATSPLASLNTPASTFARAATTPNAGLPGTTPPGVPGGPGNPGILNVGSLLSGLGLPAPGGDALMQTFNRGVSDINRLAELDARRTVVVEKTAVVQIIQPTAAQLKNAARNGVNAGKTTAGQAAQNAQQVAGNAGNTASNTVNSVTSPTMNTATGIGSQAGNSVGGAVGRGIGGLGGIGGGVRGAVGGLGGGMRGGGGGGGRR